MQPLYAPRHSAACVHHLPDPQEGPRGEGARGPACAVEPRSTGAAAARSARSAASCAEMRCWSAPTATDLPLRLADRASFLKSTFASSIKRTCTEAEGSEQQQMKNS